MFLFHAWSQQSKLIHYVNTCVRWEICCYVPLLLNHNLHKVLVSCERVSSVVSTCIPGLELGTRMCVGVCAYVYARVCVCLLADDPAASRSDAWRSVQGEHWVSARECRRNVVNCAILWNSVLLVNFWCPFLSHNHNFWCEQWCYVMDLGWGYCLI